MTKVHGKRYAYKFHFYGVSQALQNNTCADKYDYLNGERYAHTSAVVCLRDHPAVSINEYLKVILAASVLSGPKI